MLKKSKGGNDGSDPVTTVHILLVVLVIVVFLAPFISNLVYPNSKVVAFLFGGMRLIAYYIIIGGVLFIIAISEKGN